MTTWTNITKASGTAWTNAAGYGKTWNQSTFSWNSATFSWNNLYQTTWSNVSSVVTSWTNVAKAT